MTKPLRTDAESRKIAAFEAAKAGILEQFDGTMMGDFEDVLHVVQALSFMALSNGGRLSFDQSVENLRIMNVRLTRQLSKLQSTTTETMQ